LTSPLSWVFGIRAETGPVARALLWALFAGLVFGLWVYATDYPEWLKAVAIRAMPQLELKVGDPIEVRLDADRAQLDLENPHIHRHVVRDLPPIVASALPPFSPENYRPLFDRLTEDGVGGFEPIDPLTYRARVTDEGKAGERLRDLGPQPYELPVTAGESVDIAVDFLTGQVMFHLDRIARGGARAPIELPPEQERGRPDLSQYPKLPEIAALIGVGDLRMDPAADGRQRFFQGTVTDPDKASRNGLGPRRVVEPLRSGEELLLRFVPDQEPTAGHRIELSAERTGKGITIPFSPTLLTPAVLPPLTPANYPGLADRLASVGLTLTASDGVRASVQDLGLARSSGLDLGKPQELRLLPRTSLPSPTEVIDSLPVLWYERHLPEAVWLTLKRILEGFGWAVLVTLPLGLFMGSFTRIGIFFAPLRLTGMYTPLPALIPLTIAWVGIGEPQIVLFLAICMGVVLLPYVVTAVQSVPQVYLDTALTLGATRGQMFRYVLTSISWSTVFKGLKIAFAVGWTWIMLAEILGVQNGLGYIINTSQRRGYIEHVYVVIFLVILMAVLSNALWSLAGRLLFPFEQERD
jgi:NitT/TauT family transport system permease protein